MTLVVACGDGSDGGAPDGEQSPAPSATVAAEATTVTSDDGLLTIEIPEGALDDPSEVTISTVAAEELPEPLASVRGVGHAYRLEPDGLEFSEPVAVTLVLSRSDLDEAENSLAAYALVTQGADGDLELLAGQDTEWTIGEDTVAVRGELRHFSLLAWTRGSLFAELTPAAPMQPLGGTFTVRATLENVDSTGTVVLRGANGEFSTAFQEVQVASDRVFGPETLAAGDAMPGAAAFKCPDHEADDIYSVKALATSVLEDGSETLLTLWVNGEVQCVAGLPTQTPEPRLALNCDHRMPGVESDVIVRVAGLDPGETVSGTVTGTGVIGGGAFTATASGTGVAEARVAIRELATYTVTVDGESDTITVGPTCPIDED